MAAWSATPDWKWGAKCGATRKRCHVSQEYVPRMGRAAQVRLWGLEQADPPDNGLTSPSHTYLLSLARPQLHNSFLTAHHNGCSSFLPPSGARSGLGFLTLVASSTLRTWGIPH